MPVKFEDLSKKINDLFVIDYSSSYGQEFKAKQKVGSLGATFTTTVSLEPKKEGKVATPAKVSMKWPKACGLSGFNVDKLEYSAKGDFKFEAALDKNLLKVDGMELELKSNLVDFKKASAQINYTGVADTFVSFAAVLDGSKPYTLSVVRDQGPATVGCSLSTDLKSVKGPDLGLKVSQSGVSAVLLAKDSLQTFEGFGHYALKDGLDLKATVKNAATKDKGRDTTWSAGVCYKVNDEVSVKAKVDHKGGVDTFMKYAPVKGLSFVLAGKYKEGNPGYGLSVSIE